MTHASQTPNGDFLQRSTSSPAGDGRRVIEIGVRCRCGSEEWSIAKNPGLGRRIFKELGWSVGNRLSQHRCPECVSGRRRPAEPRPSATIHQLPLRDVSRINPDVPPRMPDLPELPPLPVTPLEALPALPEIPRPPTISTPTAIEEEPMAQTALAEALRPLKEVHDRKRHKRESKGSPYGYANENSARSGAWRSLRAAGFKGRIVGDKHYKLETAADGTWGFVLLNGPDDKPAKQNHRRLRAAEGKPLATRVSAKNQAEIVCERLGIGKPIENIHYSISGSPGAGYVYKILPAAEVSPEALSKDDCMTRDVAPPRVCGGGFLSRFDAKKDALGVLQATRKNGGVPLEGVDYWITQDGFNLWGWTTTNPSAAAKPEFPVNVVPPVPAMVDLQQVNGCQVVASYGNAPKPPVSIGKPDEPRKPAPRDNRRIMEALDEAYSVERQSYYASHSDAKVAEKLDLPRAWVAKVREEFYGPERNAEAEVAQKLARLDEAIGKASGALTKGQAVIDMLAELETLVAELRKLRAEISR